jgi:hypothetical protein
MTTRTLSPKVEIAFNETLIGGVFLIDSSGLDGPDGLAPDPRFYGTYMDVTDDVDEQVEITVGTDDLAGAVQASTCEFDLIRPADIGQWNPRNPLSAANSVTPGFTEMRPVRVTANDGVNNRGLFFGFIRNAHFDATSGLCHVHCEDLLLWLSRIYPEIAATGQTTTGAAIGLILDSISWDNPDLRDLAVGDTIDGFSADGTKTGVELIADLLAAERGTVYVDTDYGVVTYRDRYTAALAVPVATLTDELVDVGADLDVDRIATRVIITRTGGVAQSITDTATEATYGRGQLAQIETLYLHDDAVAAALASDILVQKRISAPPARAIVQNDNAATTQLQIGFRPLQAVTLAEDLAGTAGTYTLQQIKHRLSAQGAYLETELLATYRNPALTSFWRIDSSGLDGPDVLRY